jgi:hypothetical protein
LPDQMTCGVLHRPSEPARLYVQVEFVGENAEILRRIEHYVRRWKRWRSDLSDARNMYQQTSEGAVAGEYRIARPHITNCGAIPKHSPGRSAFRRAS